MRHAKRYRLTKNAQRCAISGQRVKRYHYPLDPCETDGDNRGIVIDLPSLKAALADKSA